MPSAAPNSSGPSQPVRSIGQIVICLTFLLYAPETDARPLQSDQLVYHRLALNIIYGNPYSRDHSPPFAPEFQRPFVYPAFLAAIYQIGGIDPAIVRYVQAALGMSMIPLIWWLTRQVAPIWASGVALTAAVLTAFNPALLSSTPYLLRETLHSVLVATLLCAIVANWSTRQCWRWVLIGALIGFCSLNRLEALAFAVVIPAGIMYELWRNGESRLLAIRIALSVLVTSLVAVSPWFIYLWLSFGAGQLGVDSAVGPANRVANIYRSADATTKFGRLALDSGLDPAATRPQEFAWDLINAYRRTHDVELFDAIYDVREAAMDYLRLYPGRWFRRALVDAVNFSAGYSDLVLFIGQERQDRFVRLGYKGLYQNSDYTTLAIFLFARFVVGLLMLSGAGLATIYWLKRRGPGLLLPAVLLAIVLPTALTGLYAPRVRVPYDPFLVCSAVVGWSIGLNWLLGAWRSRTILTSVLTLRPKYHT